MTRQLSSKSISSKSTLSTVATALSSSSSSTTDSPSPKNRSIIFGSLLPSVPKSIARPQQQAQAENRSPTNSSNNHPVVNNNNNNMERNAADRSGAFPTKMPLTSSTGSSGGSNSGGDNGITIPQSPRKASSASAYNNIPSSPVNQQRQVNLTPRLRPELPPLSIATAGGIISVGSNNNNGPGIPRSPSAHTLSSNNSVASNNSSGYNNNVNSILRNTTTPVRQQQQQQPQQQHGGGGEYGDDNATYTSHHTHGTHGSNGSNTVGIGGGGGGRFISTPIASSGVATLLSSGGGSGFGANIATSRSVTSSATLSVSSSSLGPRFATSFTSGSVGEQQQQQQQQQQHPPQQRMNKHGIDMALHESVKQKGIAKRKRKEYAKDPRYTQVRRVVDELNKAIGPETRRSAIDRACMEFDHTNELQHNAELYLGAANILCLVLSMSDQEDEIRYICSALEMVYRAEREAVIISYQDVGAALVPLLLRLLERCEKVERRKVVGVSSEATIANISRILLHMTRISDLRILLVGHAGMLAALERVATLPLSMENRILRMRLLANLANAEGNKVTIFDRPTLMEATMKVATLDKAESAREYAAAVLMDLSSCSSNQVVMARTDKVLATLVKLAVVEDRVETREYAVSGLQNLAFEKRNRMQLVSYGSGVVIEALKKCTSSDTNDKTRRRSAGALTNLACDETAEKMANHPGLFQTLAQASVSDKNEDVQQRATLALTKLANSITVKMSCWDTHLDALITASRCTVADGIVSAMFRVKTRAEGNRSSMANHPRLLETLAQLCLRTTTASGTDNVVHENDKNAYKDCENATKAIAHLANDPLNHKLICNKHILAALVHGANLGGKAGMVTRDTSILAMERLAMELSNRPMMARFPGMLVSIAKATEREMNEELNGIPTSSVTGQPRLAKPLLMSLLVAM